VKAAVDDGREAARERETELRANGPGSDKDAR
jgi:hypothetical protein